jgi:hypothetical protein
VAVAFGKPPRIVLPATRNDRIVGSLHEQLDSANTTFVPEIGNLASAFGGAKRMSRVIKMSTPRPKPVNLPRTAALTKALDVEVEHPIRSPTTLPGFDEGVVRGPPRPISIRIPVEYRFQVSFDHHLGDTVGDRRNP